VKDFSRRGYIVKTVADYNFSCVHVLFDTNKFDKGKIPSDVLAYNYICRFLLERVSWYLRDTNREGKIILSSRGTARDNDLQSYIWDKLIPYHENEISPVFTGVECKAASSWDMLQLADICTTSMFYSHEVNAYGMTVPCFAMRLWAKNYRHNGQVDRYGVKYFSDEMKPSSGALKPLKLCYVTKEKPPAQLPHE
jgi:hypothetical protein